MRLSRPSILDLREYALGTASVETSNRMRRYLLTSGDDEALAYVAGIADAARRLEEVRAEAAASSVVERLLSAVGMGGSLTRLPSPGVYLVTPEMATMSPGAIAVLPTIQLEVAEPRWLYLVAGDSTGRWWVLHPRKDTVRRPERTTPSVGISYAARVVLAIESEEDLLPAEANAMPEHDLANVLLRATPGRPGVRVRSLPIPMDDESDDE